MLQPSKLCFCIRFTTSINLRPLVSYNIWPKGMNERSKKKQKSMKLLIFYFNSNWCTSEVINLPSNMLSVKRNMTRDTHLHTIKSRGVAECWLLVAWQWLVFISCYSSNTLGICPKIPIEIRVKWKRKLEYYEYNQGRVSLDFTHTTVSTHCAPPDLINFFVKLKRPWNIELIFHHSCVAPFARFTHDRVAMENWFSHISSLGGSARVGRKQTCCLYK